MIPLILGGAAAALGSGAQIVGALKKTDLEKQQEERLNKLAAMDRMGALGLTGQEKALRERELLTPGRIQATQLQSRNEALAAATGLSDAQQLASMQEGTQRVVADQAQQGANAIVREDSQRELQQRGEIAALQGSLQQQKDARKAALYQGIAGAVGAVGALAAVPTATKGAKAVKGGNPIGELTDAMDKMGFTPEESAKFAAMTPEQIKQIMASIGDGTYGGKAE
jgi:hypothetical protein